MKKIKGIDIIIFNMKPGSQILEQGTIKKFNGIF